MLKIIKLNACEEFRRIPLPLQTHSLPVHRPEILSTKETNQKIRKLYSSSHFSYEVIRRATFDQWPCSYINRDELAKAGFYYTKNSDMVQCHFCKGVVGYWENGDRPIREHEKHFPRCPLVRGELTSNVPLGNGSDGKKNLNSMLNECLLTSIENGGPQVSQTTFQTDSMFCEGSAAYPYYSLFEKRLFTLTNYQSQNGPSADSLASAGFFYTGISDYVICFQCGGGLFNWSKDDDPWSDHKKYYGHCPFVNPESSERKNNFPKIILTSEEEDLLLQYPISQKLIGMGLSHHSIKSAMKEHLEKYSCLPETFMDCTDVVVEWDERNSNELNSLEETDLIKISTDVRQLIERKELFISFTNNTKVETLQLEISEEEDEGVEEADSDEEVKYKCRRCRRREIEVVTLPCQHFHYCKSCITEKSKFCYTCNEVICKLVYPRIAR